MALFRKKTVASGRTRPSSPDKDKGRAVPAYSYHNARSDSEDSSGRNMTRLSASELKTKSFWLNRFGFIILLIVCLICLYSALDLSSSPNVVLLGDQSNSELYKLYKPAFLITSKNLFSGSILNHNKVTVDTTKITDTLETDFPEFSSISITLPLINHRPIIYLVPAKPSVILANSKGQYLLNENGIAMLYGDSDNGFSYLNLPVVTDQSGLQISIGKPALTTQSVNFIQTVTAELASKGDVVSAMTLPQSTSELDVSLTGKPYFGKFNLQDDDPKVQAGTFLATQNYLSTQNITPSQYIDVRTDGRSYYK
jgi:hypothetical protein